MTYPPQNDPWQPPVIPGDQQSYPGAVYPPQKRGLFPLSGPKLVLFIGGVVAVLLCGLGAIGALIGDDNNAARNRAPVAVETTRIAAVPQATPSPTLAPVAPAPTSAKPSPVKTSAKPVYYANCAAVRAAGKAPLRKDQPGYRLALDADKDGLACERVENVPPPPPQTDPRYSTCAEAKSHGYGPYYKGRDPEYYWYIDRDKDGVVCE